MQIFQTGHLQDEHQQLDQDLEENQSERNQKYRELRRREENMDQFLSGFESAMAQELERLSSQEAEVVRVAAAMSADLERAGHLPTAQGFSVMRDDLAFKEVEAEKSRNTLEGVTREHAQLQANLEKVSEDDLLVKTFFHSNAVYLPYNVKICKQVKDLRNLRKQCNISCSSFSWQSIQVFWP